MNQLQNAQAGGGSGGTRNKLTEIGVGLRNLPSQQIPGLGVGTDAIGNIFRIFGKLEPMAVGFAAAIGVGVAAVSLLQARTEELRKAAQSELDARTAALKLLKTGTGAD
jgi:hypothetical protein